MYVDKRPGENRLRQCREPENKIMSLRRDGNCNEGWPQLPQGLEAKLKDADEIRQFELLFGLEVRLPR